MVRRAVPLRERFWFLPAVICAAAVVLAQSLVEVDQWLGAAPRRVGGFTYRVGAAGSRDLLGAVAGSVLTVAATTFSITIAVLALTTSSYGPRLVRNFMADRGNQTVLGVFLASYLYALLVARSVQVEGEDGAPTFVPHIAVNVAVLLAVLDIAVLVYFIHHISDSIQISTLSGRVREDLRATIEHLYPEAGTDAAADDDTSGDVSAADVLAPDWRARARPVFAHGDGYVAVVDGERLVRLAERHDVTVVLECVPGDHLVHGDPVGRIIRMRTGDPENGDRGSVDDGLEKGIRDAVVLGTTRTPAQDVRFTVLQLVEIAVRALSPGTNDPFTAMNALDDLSASLSVMACRAMPSPVRLGPDGAVRLVAPAVHLDEILSEVFAYVRGYALGAPEVLHRALALASAVGLRSRTTAIRLLLDREVATLMEAYAERSPLPQDLQRLVEHAGAVRRGLNPGAAE